MKNTIKNRYLNALIVLFLLSSSGIGLADESKSLPLWEVGLGVGALHQSYYTGTKQTRAFAFPVIIPTYRGKVF